MQAHSAHTPTLWTIWGQTFTLLTQTFLSVRKIALGFFLLPLLLLEIFMGYQGIATGSAIQSATTAQEQAPTASGYLNLVASFYTFLGPYLFGLLAVMIVLLTGYIALILFFLQVRTEETIQPLKQICLRSLKLLLPKGIPFLGFFLLLSLEQAFFSSLRVFSAFALMAIVISLYEKLGMWRSLLHALFFRYTGLQRGGAFRIAFILVMTLSFFSMAQVGLEFFFLHFHTGEGINTLPAFLRVPLWGMPFSLLGLLGHGLRLAGYSFLLTFLAGFSVTLYMEASPTLGERIMS